MVEKDTLNNKFDESLLKILACPVCKTAVKYIKKNQILSCMKCKRKYPIREGIPVMLPDEAVK